MKDCIIIDQPFYTGYLFLYAWDVTFDKNATMAIVSYSSTNQTSRILILTVIKYG